MTRIEVTQPAAEGSATLTLHTCSTCGTHRWERDGVALDRDAVLGVVRDRLAEGPAPRVPKPRTARARPAPTALPQARTIDIREQLARFTVHGGPNT
jgi:hypothetical protein